MKKKTFGVSCILLPFLLSLPVYAAGTKESAEPTPEKIVLKFGHVLQLDHPYHLMAIRFKEELEKADSRFDVQIFPAGQLGNERELIEALQLGTVDVATITSAVTANFVPGFKVFSLPFIFRDAEHLFRVMDSPIGDDLAKDMVKANLIKLGYAYGGSRDLYGSVSLSSLEELKGKKIRTMENNILLDTWNALGAIATPIPWGDLYLSLQQKVVDGGEGTGVSYQSMKFFDVAPYYSRINYVFSWHNFMMSAKTWKNLNENLRTVIMKAAKTAQDYERKLFVAEEEALFEKLQKEFGVKVSTPSDIKSWRDGVKSVYEKNAGSVGGMPFILKIANY